MTKVNKANTTPKPPYTYSVTVSGDGIEKIIAPLTKTQVDYWSHAGSEALFNQTFCLNDEQHYTMEKTETYLPDWRVMEDAVYFEGIEAHHGHLEVTTEDGLPVWDIALEDDNFWDDYVDDLVEIRDVELKPGSPGNYVGTTAYNGQMHFTIVTRKTFDPKLMYCFMTEINGILFLTSIYYDGVLLEGGLDGRYELQSLRLVKRSEDGTEVSYYSIRPQDGEVFQEKILNA